MTKAVTQLVLCKSAKVLLNRDPSFPVSHLSALTNDQRRKQNVKQKCYLNEVI